MPIENIRPNADGTTNEWIPLSGTDNYAMVDEETADDNSTYVTASQASKLLIGLRTNSTNYWSGTEKSAAEAEWNNVSDGWATNPDLTAPNDAWTKAAIDALEIGVQAQNIGLPEDLYNLPDMIATPDEISLVTINVRMKKVTGKIGSVLYVTKVDVDVTYTEAEGSSGPPDHVVGPDGHGVVNSPSGRSSRRRP